MATFTSGIQDSDDFCIHIAEWQPPNAVGNFDRILLDGERPDFHFKSWSSDAVMLTKKRILFCSSEPYVRKYWVHSVSWSKISGYAILFDQIEKSIERIRFSGLAIGTFEFMASAETDRNELNKMIDYIAERLSFCSQYTQSQKRHTSINFQSRAS